MHVGLAQAIILLASYDAAWVQGRMKVAWDEIELGGLASLDGTITEGIFD